jgi:hypothetical protein
VSDVGRLDDPFRRWLLPDEHVLAVISAGTTLTAPPGYEGSVITTEAAFVDPRGRLVRLGGARLVAGSTGQAFVLAATASRLFSILVADGEPDRVLTASLASVRGDSAWTPGESTEGRTFERRPGALRLTVSTTEGTWSSVVDDVERRHAEALAALFHARFRWSTTASGSAPRMERATEQFGLLLVATICGWMAAAVAAVAIGSAFPGFPGGWQAPAIGLAPFGAFAIDWVARAITRLRDSDAAGAPRARFGPVGRTVLWAMAWTITCALGAAALR